MRLWIHMNEQQLQELQSGILHQNHEFTREENSDFAFPYAWLVGQMERRVGVRPMGVQVPIWAWYSFYGKHRRPDLRVNSFSGCDDYMVEVEVDSARVLLSDYQLWHFPLNNWYLPKSEAESKMLEEQFENEEIVLPWELEFKAIFDQEMRTTGDKLRSLFEAGVKVYGSSWEQIFDLGYNVSGYVDAKPELQGTIWELRKEDLVKVCHINRNKRANDIAEHNRRQAQRVRFYSISSIEEEEEYRRWDEIIEWGVSGVS